jgi:hypothetical protein
MSDHDTRAVPPGRRHRIAEQFAARPISTLPFHGRRSQAAAHHQTTAQASSTTGGER